MTEGFVTHRRKHDHSLAADNTALNPISIKIGANTLDTTEWANLDGLNQQLDTAKSPTFAGLIVPQIGPSGDADLIQLAANALTVNGTITTTDAINMSKAALLPITITTANVVVGPKIVGRESLGTLASPTAIGANYPLIRITGQGYGATGWSGDVGIIDIQSAQAFTDSAQGTKIVFYTTPLNSTTAAVAMLLDGSGALTAGDTSITDLIFTDTDFHIRADTADGSDNKWLRMAGGGDDLSTRGGVIYLTGNEATANYRGTVYLQAGVPGTTGTYDGMIVFAPNGAVGGYFDRSANLTLTGGIGTQGATPQAGYGFANDGAYITYFTRSGHDTWTLLKTSSFGYGIGFYNVTDTVYGLFITDAAAPAIISPSGTGTIGNTSYYWPTSYIIRNYFNSTAYLDGAAAGAIDSSSVFRVIGTGTPGAGTGVEIHLSGGIGYVQAYNRTTPAFVPLKLRGSTTTLAAGATDALIIDASANANFTGTIVAYNNIATEGYGVPAIVDRVGLTGLSADIAATNMSNTNVAGEYVVHYYLFTTTTQGGTPVPNVNVSILWNDGAAARTVTSSTISLATATYTQGIIFIRNNGTVYIQYSTDQTNITTGRYALYTTCERVN